MKRLLFIIIYLMLPFISHAQLNVTKVNDEIVTISSLRVGNISLKKQGDTYYLGIMSNNQFDLPQIFYLGTSRESAISTLNDMVELIETIGKSTVVVDNGGRSLSLYKVSSMALGIDFNTGAGTYWIATNEAKKFIKALE